MQMLDMVQPKEEGRIHLQDLKSCSLTPIFFDTFINLDKYLEHEQKDPFSGIRVLLLLLHAHSRFMAHCVGLPRWAGTRRDIHPLTPETCCGNLSSFCFLRHGKDNKGKYADNPAGRHPIRTNDAPTSIIPPILCRMPFLLQPSQFILARDRHQICWIA